MFVIPQKRLLFENYPGWVGTDFVSLFGGPPPDVIVRFAKGIAWQRGVGEMAPEALVTCSCSSSRYRDDLSGNWSLFGPNVLARSNKGARAWESRTNVVLWDRDLTNAAWTASNVTAAKNQTGVDNVANSASSITATAGNGTLLQAITLGSSARFQSAFVKRITGSGVVNMTMDNGATWTAITVTSSWTLVSIPTQTLANPTVGFQIVTNGDAIAVDFVQNENNAFMASPPKATTSAAVTELAETLTLTTVPAFAGAAAMYAAGTPAGPTNYSLNQQLLMVSDNSNNNRLQLGRALTNGDTNGIVETGGSVKLNGLQAAWGQSAAGKVAIAADAVSQAFDFNGAAVSAAAGAGFPIGMNKVNIGSDFGSTHQFNGDITDIAIWASTRIANAGLIAGTT